MSAAREQAALNRERRLRLEAKALAYLVQRGRVYSVELADALYLPKARGRAYAAQILGRLWRDGYTTREWSRTARNGSGRWYHSPTDKARERVAGEVKAAG